MLTIASRKFGDCSEHRGPGDIADQMQTKLKKVFEGEYDHVEVTNPDGMGQQVIIFVISNQFEGKMPIMRHRMINELLKDEIKLVHACQIEAKTVDQME